MRGPSVQEALLRFGLALGAVLSPGVARAEGDADEPAPAPAPTPPLDALTIAKLVDRLAHADNDERDRVHRILGRGGRAVVAPLIELLKSADATAGAWAAEVLALVGRDAIDAADALAVGLGRDGMDWPCANALEALGPPGIPGLVRGLAFEREGSRLAALVSLEKVGPLPESAFAPLAKAAKDPSEDIRSGAAGCLAKLDLPLAVRLASISTLVADPSSEVRSAVLHALIEAAGTDVGAVVPLALLAGDPQALLRVQATKAIAAAPRSTSERDVVENTLSRGLGDRDGDVRAAAIEAFIDHDLADDVVRERISSMTEDADTDVRVESLRALGRAKALDDAARKRLEKGLVDPESRVKIAAAAALARSGVDVERALDVLFGREGIYHAVERARLEVVRFAGELGPASAAARKRLESIVKDQAEEYRAAAEAATRRIDEAAKK